MKNSVEFKITGRYALFTDPVTRMGVEKYSYHIPTYEALKGIVKSVYWKPTIIWIIDEVRIMKPIKTEAKSAKPLSYGGGNTLAVYTYLSDIEYQVKAYFEWNLFREDMAQDRIDGKHYQIANRMIEKGGRQDIFLGARECQGYVEPCRFGEGAGAYDGLERLDYGVMFHGFDYPDETGRTDENGNPDENGAYYLHSRFWKPVMKKGVVKFIRPKECTMRKFVRAMEPYFPQSIGLDEEALQNELA